MPKDYVRWRQEGNIAILELDNPPLNVLNSKLVVALQGCLNEIREKEDCRALVLTGKGKAFAAGADIEELDELLRLSAATHGLTRKMHETLEYLESFPGPTIAAINGVALGGGLELALAFDFRIAAKTASLGMPEIRLGLFPGFGGTQRLPRLIGVSRAKEMLFSGKPITATESQRIGLVNRVVPPGEVLSASKKMAHSLAARPGRALQLLKEAVDKGLKMPLQEGCSLERDLFEEVFRTADAEEGIGAFLEKREAQFKHY